MRYILTLIKVFFGISVSVERFYEIMFSSNTKHPSLQIEKNATVIVDGPKIWDISYPGF